MTLSKSFYLGAMTAFLCFLALAEMLLRITVPTGFWYKHFDFSGDMTGMAEIRDRLQYPPKKFSSDHPILFLGDSVLGASALVEHRIPGARTQTLSSLLCRRFESAPGFPLSLGSDGLLLPDIEGLTQEFMPRRPRTIVLLLNFRMFAQDFADGPKALSRSFLSPDLPADIQKRTAPNPPLTQEARLSDSLYTWMCAHWLLFRETQMARVLWYYPSQKDFFQRQLERVVGKNDTQSDIFEAALKQKVAPYYQPYLWDMKGLPFTCLKNVLDQWTGSLVHVVVILTPQNKNFLGDYLDKPSFDKNRKNLAAFMKPYARSGVDYLDWSDRYPSSLFLDHCHLTPEGNEKYADDIKNHLGKGRYE